MMSGLPYYSEETRMAMRQRTLERDSADDDLLKAFGPITSYADLERKEAIQARQESRLEKYKSPMRAELESHFESLGYEPLSLPPPLPKALSAIIRPPYGRHPLTPEVEPFTTACQEGTLDIVKYWVREKRDVLRQVGLQHGLAFASWKDQINVVRYLLGEGAVLDGAVIELACSTFLYHCLGLQLSTAIILTNKYQASTGPCQLRSTTAS